MTKPTEATLKRWGMYLALGASLFGVTSWAVAQTNTAKIVNALLAWKTDTVSKQIRDVTYMSCYQFRKQNPRAKFPDSCKDVLPEWAAP